jgi:uncharacterized repeat protein (TIGR01451 family)
MTTKSRSSFRARPVFAAAVLLLVAASDPLSAAERERDARAEKPPTSRAPAPAPQLVLPERSGTSRAVRDIPRVYRVSDPHKLREVKNESLEEGRRPRAVDTRARDEALQSTMPALQAPAPIINFEGISQAVQGSLSGGFFTPPDTVGDVGPDHYVQCVNTACQVFAKNGTAAGPAFLLSSLFQDLGGACATTDDGDPIVLYDPLADRWHLSQFALPAFPNPPFSECIAVSQTGDPTGAYYVYQYVMPNGYLNDYPKFGVWPDGYYMTAPLFGGPNLDFIGEAAFAFNRAKMLVGDPSAEMVFFDLSSYRGLQRILPADVDGVAPPPETPAYMLSITADEFADVQDGIRMFEVRPDYANPAASTFTEIASLAVAGFDATFTETNGSCAGSVPFTSRDDVDQPPPATCGQRLDAIADRPMQRLAYRNLGLNESLVFSHAVDVNGTPPSATTGHVSGVRYYELRRPLPSGAFAVHEQATFSPDTTHRWMSSAAMDGNGNIAVGYSTSDATTTFPGVRYAGRLAADPPGGLFQGEATLVAGGRAQTSTASRWGDYSAMSVDPADDCTFWYTQEYYDPVLPGGCSASACWQTRIGSFKFPSCSSGTGLGTLQGIVTVDNPPLNQALPGALVQANGYSAVTNSSGFYKMTVPGGPPGGTYTVTASKSGFGTVLADGVVVAAGGTTTQDFSLGTGKIAGVVTSAATASPIAGALVEVPGGYHVLADASGAYSIPLPAYASYSLTVSAAGYFPATRSGLAVGPSGTTTANVALMPAPVLAVASLAVNDSIGNNNGAVDYGECFTLVVTLRNTGTIAATDVAAALTAMTPGVTVHQYGSPYPVIPDSGGTAANVLPFLLSSGPDPLQVGKPIKLTLSLTTTNGSFSLSFELPTGGGGAPSVFAATGPVAIPDNNFVGASLAVPVAAFAQALSKVKVAVRISHTYSGDLLLRLIGPDGTTVTLATQVGGSAPGYGTDCPADANDTTFDDAAATPIGSGTGPFVGSFRPEQPLHTFAGKTGAQVNGIWQLKVIDLGPADIGNIECATLTLNGTVFGGCTSSDLSITKSDGIDVYGPGQHVTYSIVAANSGPTAAPGSPVADTFPPSLTGVTWTCNASAGSSCAAASGSGSIATTVSLAAGGTATFTAQATVSPSATGAIVNTATIDRGDGREDPIPGNNSATDDDRPLGSYFTLTPCRLVDTRNPPGPNGGPALSAGESRTIVVSGLCGIPLNATAVVVNTTVVSPTAAGNLRIFPTGTPVPQVSALNYAAGQVRGNNGIFGLTAGGVFDIRCTQSSGTADVIVDVLGYFRQAF